MRYWTRVGTAAGYLSAAILLINAAKRAGIIPLSDFTQLIAPLAQLAAIVFFLAILRRGSAGAAVLGVNIVVLASLVGVEFVINLVFPVLPAEQIVALRQGPVGVALTICSIAFLLASLWLAAVSVAGLGPGVVIYAAGTVPVALRAFVPELVLDLGLLVMAIGVAAMATRFLRTR